METNTIIFIIVWAIIIVEFIYFIISYKKGKQLNTKPTHNYKCEDVSFMITKITLENYGLLSKYTISAGFFKKSNSKHFIYQEFYFYDKSGKYNVGDRLFLNRNKENVS